MRKKAHLAVTRRPLWQPRELLGLAAHVPPRPTAAGQSTVALVHAGRTLQQKTLRIRARILM